MLRRRMHAGRLIPHLLKPGVLFHIALAFQSPASLFDGWWHDGKHRIDNSGVWKKGLTPVLPWVQDGTCEVPARGEAEPGHGGEQSFFVVGLPAPAQVHKFLPAAVTVPGCGQLSCRDHQFTSLKPPISWETQPLFCVVNHSWIYRRIWNVKNNKQVLQSLTLLGHIFFSKLVLLI